MIFFRLIIKVSQIETITLSIALIWFSLLTNQTIAQNSNDKETRIVIESQGWKLVGDLKIPVTNKPPPVVLMLNKAAGTRADYVELANQLAARGIASLRLDLRGHGESINLGKFIPAEADSLTREFLIWQSDSDVISAINYLKSNPQIDGSKIGIIGASYSGEEMAEAGRKTGYAQAYVALSPGSFSDESIKGIDSSHVPWLYVASKKERFLQEITALVQSQSETVEMIILPGKEHATRILNSHNGIAERIAVWLTHILLK